MKLRSLLLLGAACGLLGACTPKEIFSTAIKVGQVVWDPTIQVGDAKDQPTMVAFSLYASPTTNPNPNSVPPELENGGQEVSLTLTAQSQEELLEQVREKLMEMEGDVSQVEEELSAVSQTASNEPVATQYIRYRVLSGADAKDTSILLEVPTGSAANMQIQSSAAGVNMTAAAQGERGVSRSDILFSPQTSQPQTDHSLQIGEYGGRAAAAETITSVSDMRNMAANGGLEDLAISDYPLSMARAIATPVSFKVLQLTDDSMFLNADADSLSADISKALGSTYIKSDDYVLRPGQFKYIDFKKIDSETRYIAVFAQFHEMNGTAWKQVVPVVPKGRAYNLMVGFSSNVVSLQEEGTEEEK